MTLGLRLLVFGICVVIIGCKPTAEQPSPADANPPKKRITGQEEVAPSAPATSPIDDKTAQSLVPAPPVATNPEPGPLPKGEGAKDVDPASVDVQGVNFAGFDDAVQSFQGKIVVADFWGTWCTVCKEKFPKFVDLAKSYEGRDEIVFVTVANELEAGIDEVKEYLAKSNPPTKNYLLEENPSEVPARYGSEAGLPLYLVYAADGQVALRTNDVEAAVQKVHELLPLTK